MKNIEKKIIQNTAEVIYFLRINSKISKGHVHLLQLLVTNLQT